jgi:hypothetical protein
MYCITETHLIRTSTTLARKQSGSKHKTKLNRRCENIVILKHNLGECIMLHECQ